MNIEKSLAMQKKASAFIPGMTQLLSKRPDMFSYGVWPGYYSRAEGCTVWDLDGNRYTDMSIAGIGANILGYAVPEVDDAVRRAISAGSSSSLNCPEEVELAELLCELHPWAHMARFTRGGGESMALAVRIARAHTRRDRIAFCGYHGWHDWYLAANVGTEDALGEHLISGLSPAGVPQGLKGTALPFRYNQPEELEAIAKKYPGELAAIVMEPIRNSPPAAGFFEAVRRIAAETGAVLIVDEISAGLRMNTGGAHLKIGLQPDIAVFSKALGNGYPIGAVIGKRDVMQAAQSTFISSTCWTERTGPVAAIATLRRHRELDAGPYLMKLGESVQAGWQAQAAKHGIHVHVGGLPAMSHFSFEHENPLALKALFVQLMLEKGFLATTAYYAMAAHRHEHVAAYLEAVDSVFAEMAPIIDEKSVMQKLKGHPASAGFKRLT